MINFLLILTIHLLIFNRFPTFILLIADTLILQILASCYFQCVIESYSLYLSPNYANYKTAKQESTGHHPQRLKVVPLFHPNR